MKVLGMSGTAHMLGLIRTALFSKVDKGDVTIPLLKDDLFSAIYPVGSIYISVVDTSPEELFGVGAWEQIKDTFLLSAGDVYEAGSVGGEAEHTLTIDEMPKHAHRLKTDINSPDYNITWPEWFEYTDGWTQEADETESPATQTTQTGGDEPHNNMPPYLTVYMWKRVS